MTLVPVCGSAASGAPRLARMLGAAPGAFLLGDVKKLWSRGARDNQRCGCCKPFLECGFWREVGEAAFGGWQGPVLARAADARVRWVHVVRDPRDTAWLWMTGTVKMGGPLPISTAGIVARWGRYNVIPPLLSGIEGVPYLRVRFESLSREPGATLDRVLRFVAAGGHPPAAPVSDHSLIVLDRDTGPCRLVDADFRNQHETAAARLPETDRWRQEMPTMARVAVTAVTLPMMRAFGYAGKTSRHPADEAL